MAQRQPNRQPQRRPVPKARQAPSGRAGKLATRRARPAPMHRNHAKRGRR